MSLKAWLLVIFAIAPFVASAQVDEALEQMVAETESDDQAAAWADWLTEIHENRINLNDTATLNALPLLSPFQVKALKNYISLYGQLLSHKELRFIPGFDSTLVALLENLTVVEPFSPPQRLRLADGRNTVIAGMGGTLEQAAGYRDGRYDGDALHSQLIYSYNLNNRISLRLVAEKDPTEPWGKGNFYSYHLMLNDIGRLERLIVGRYNLQFGQGLTLWTGLHPFNLLGATPQRFGRGVRPSSTFYEDGYQEGLAATMRLAKVWHLSAFASKTHGTRLLGGHLEYRNGNLIAGLTAVNTALDDSIAPANRVYNQDYFRGNRLTNLGVDATWQWRRLTLYGEIAMCDSGATAAIGGARLTLNDRNSLGISYRNYSQHYHNLNAQPYAIGDGRNERGWTLDAKTRLPLNIDAMLSIDLHCFPSLRYGSYHPSSGAWIRSQLSRRLGHGTTATLRYAYRQKDRNIPYSTASTYEHEETLRQQLQATLHHEHGHWMFDTKAALAGFESNSSGIQRGWAVIQQARFTYRLLRATAGASLFNVDGYYTRIYLNESYLQYNFTMPSYYGQGIRAFLIIQCDLGKNLAIAGKYAITHYFDRTSVGSGAAETEGPNRQTAYLQLRWKF